LPKRRHRPTPGALRGLPSPRRTRGSLVLSLVPPSTASDNSSVAVAGPIGLGTAVSDTVVSDTVVSDTDTVTEDSDMVMEDSDRVDLVTEDLAREDLARVDLDTEDSVREDLADSVEAIVADVHP